MNEQNFQPDQNQNLQPVKKDGVCLASLICGIISFCCCNPCYLVSIAAIVTGIIGIAGNKNPKDMAIAGLALGALSIIICIIVDVVMLPFTMGTSFFF